MTVQYGGNPLLLADAETKLAALGPYRERLVLGPLPAGTEAVPAVAYLEPPTLLSAIEKTAAALGTGNMRVAASLWSKKYNAAVLRGVLAAMTLTGVGLNASVTNTSILLGDGEPKTLVVHGLSDAVLLGERFREQNMDCCDHLFQDRLGQLHKTVLCSLFPNHLALLIRQVERLTGLSRSILWGNAGNLCAHLYDKLDEWPGARVAAREDRVALLEQAVSPVFGGRNPLYRPVRYVRLSEPELPPTVAVRYTCCQRYRLAGVNPCYTCPRLTDAERIAIMKQMAPE